jgi:hypothetical protein
VKKGIRGGVERIEKGDSERREERKAEKWGFGEELRGELPD